MNYVNLSQDFSPRHEKHDLTFFFFYTFSKRFSDVHLSGKHAFMV